MSTEVAARKRLREYTVSNEQEDVASRLAQKKGKTGAGSIIIKPQLCGKYCSGCPHGPYAWHVYKGEWTYLGSVGASLGKKPSEKETEAKTGEPTDELGRSSIRPGQDDSENLMQEFADGEFEVWKEFVAHKDRQDGYYLADSRYYLNGGALALDIKNDGSDGYDVRLQNVRGGVAEYKERFDTLEEAYSAAAALVDERTSDTPEKSSSSGSSRSMSYGEKVEYEKEFVREAAHANAEGDYRGTPEDFRVEQIQGIGPQRAEVLREQGIETRADIVEMDRDDLLDLYLALPRDSFRSIKQVYDQYHGDE